MRVSEGIKFENGRIILHTKCECIEFNLGDIRFNQDDIKYGCEVRHNLTKFIDNNTKTQKMRVCFGELKVYVIIMDSLFGKVFESSYVYD